MEEDANDLLLPSLLFLSSYLKPQHHSVWDWLSRSLLHINCNVWTVHPGLCCASISAAPSPPVRVHPRHRVLSNPLQHPPVDKGPHQLDSNLLRKRCLAWSLVLPQPWSCVLRIVPVILHVEGVSSFPLPGKDPRGRENGAALGTGGQ